MHRSSLSRCVMNNTKRLLIACRNHHDDDLVNSFEACVYFVISADKNNDRPEIYCETKPDILIALHVF